MTDSAVLPAPPATPTSDPHPTWQRTALDFLDRPPTDDSTYALAFQTDDGTSLASIAFVPSATVRQALGALLSTLTTPPATLWIDRTYPHGGHDTVTIACDHRTEEHHRPLLTWQRRYDPPQHPHQTVRAQDRADRKATAARLRDAFAKKRVEIGNG